MKKIIALFISLVMLMSVTAYATKVDFLKENYLNYTGEGSLEIRFKNSEDLATLINELDYSGTIENYLDLEAFLKSLLSLDSEMLLQVDMSNDFKSVKMALTTETSQTVNVNSNLSADIKAKEGMWMTMDFSDMENPVFRMIYSRPVMNKYVVMDLPQLMGEDFAAFANVMQSILNRDFLESVNGFTTEILEKYADIKVSYGKCVITIDNDGFLNIAKEVCDYVFAAVEELIKINMGESQAEEFAASIGDIDLSGIKILGKKGIKYTYFLKNGKINKAQTVMDIDIDLKPIYERFAETEWAMQSDGKISIDVNATEKIKRLGSTKVMFPELTEENSVNLADMMPQYEPYEQEEPVYPHYYVWCDTDKLPVIDGEIYVPLRKTIESAYDDTAEIEYDRGIIRLSCEHFPAFKNVTLTNNSDKVYTENGEFITKKVFVEDGVTYVASSLFVDLFGWEFSSAEHNMLYNEYYYGFYTQTY